MYLKLNQVKPGMKFKLSKKRAAELYNIERLGVVDATHIYTVKSTSSSSGDEFVIHGYSANWDYDGASYLSECEFIKKVVVLIKCS